MKTNQFNSLVGAFLIALVTLVLMGCTDSETPSAIRTVSLQLASDVIGNSIADHEVTSIHIDQNQLPTTTSSYYVTTGLSQLYF